MFLLRKKFSIKKISFVYQYHKATNEPILGFLSGSKERKLFLEKLKEYDSKEHEIPIVIGGKEIKSDQVVYQKKPFDHRNNLAKFYWADKETLQKAIDVSQEAFTKWEATPFEYRADIMTKASKLVFTKYRYDLLAATMLGQGKTLYQAEIDASCEMGDFFNFNVQWAYEARQWKPISQRSIINELQWRGTEGFWAVISPFNFTAIAGHLASAPAFLGNVVVWKPSDTSILANYLTFKLLKEAGIPDGVINFVPCRGPLFGEVISSSPYLAGVNFTGSSKTFASIWRSIAEMIDSFHSYPRLLGECGGKNFHLAHNSFTKSKEDLEYLVNLTIQSAFEFSGQKCSACSRLYIPRSSALKIKEMLVETSGQLKLGPPSDSETFLSAVIDNTAYKKIKSYISLALNDPSLSVLGGGKCDDSIGYYIEPTIIETKDPKHKIMQEEIFGPVLTLYVYEDSDYDDVLSLIDSTTPYALTGSVFVKNNQVLEETKKKLRFSAGNFYVNDKSTGAVVAQQPFGGARKSGTNDKAGGPNFILRFVNPLTIKTQSQMTNQLIYDYMKEPF